MDDIDTLLSILENSTRRSILRQLLIEDSYGLELSKSLGISQQAINKQLEILEKANMILSMGTVPSSFGPPRKVYRPTGFLSVVIDYTPSFIQVAKYTLEAPKERESGLDNSLKRIRSINSDMEKLILKRQELLEEKNQIVQNMRNKINSEVKQQFARRILLDYIDSMDEARVAEELDVPIEIVQGIIDTFFEE